ncbi:MAG: hypothetical protein FWD40_10970 [Treponema sp.]|nr:hypothetical protein [Treponema sp.]
MDKDTWNNFVKAKERFKKETEKIRLALPDLKNIQQKLADSRSYTVETPVVYNNALDDITIDDEIKLILVADNPGRREQAAENRKYLIGPSGKIAKKFFSDNPSLGIDFTKNVIILNKTPVHTPRTNELRQLCLMDNLLGAALDKSQKSMALTLLEFHKALDCPVWITGYSEMRRGGIFEVYTKSIKELYSEPGNQKLYKKVFIYRHFSMNQFTIDLKKQRFQEENVLKSLKRIGIEYRNRILESASLP